MLRKSVRPDSKGRISLGRFAKGVSGFYLSETKNHEIILEPFTEIPLREKWLFDNKVALQKVKQGLKDAAEGRISERKSFSKYLEDDE